MFWQAFRDANLVSHYSILVGTQPAHLEQEHTDLALLRSRSDVVYMGIVQ